MNESTMKSPYFKATEEVVLILERSKKSSDEFIDRLPGLYLVADQNGTIYRTNNSFKDFMQKSYRKDNLFNVFDFIAEDQKEFFKNKMELAFETPHKTFYFEVHMNFSGTKMKFSIGLYSWNVNQKADGVQLFSIVGTDVSELETAALDNKRMREEIQSAEQLQALVLPEKTREEKDFSLYSYYQAAAECGGDFLYHQYQDGLLRIWAGDVTGHGVGPAMVTGVVKGAVSILEKQNDLDIISKMRHLNQSLLDFAKGEYFMTFQIVEIDLKAKEMQFCQAGHTEIFEFLPKSLDSSNSVWDAVNTLSAEPSTPLGTSGEPKFSLEKRSLLPDAYYVCFSDGFEEAENPQGKLFGQRRLLGTYVKSLRGDGDLASACDTLLEKVQRFGEFRPLIDDISLWSLKLKNK